jgi:hypothetical protein
MRPEKPLLLSKFVEAKIQQEFGAQNVNGQKHDITGTPAGPYGHGAGGLFNQPGVDDRIVSLVPLPKHTILNYLPVVQDETATMLAVMQGQQLGNQFGALEQVRLGSITNIDAGPLDQGVLTTAECEPWQQGGDMRFAVQGFPLARKGFRLKTMNAFRAGLLNTGADPIYLRLLNEFGFNQQMMPQVAEAARSGSVLAIEFYKRLMEGVTGWSRKLTREVWSSTSSATASSNKEKNFQGMNALINTGQKDIAGNFVPALDSLVRNYGANINASGGAFMSLLFSMHDAMMRNNMLRNLDVQGHIYMHPLMWTDFAKQFGVVDHLYAINSMVTQMGNQGGLIINARDAQMARVDMMQNMYVPINGINYPVRLDDGMPLLNKDSATPTGSVVFIPERVNNQIATGFIPYNQDNENSNLAYNFGHQNQITWTSDGGLFRWFVEQTRECITYSAEMAATLFCRATAAAWRIDGVQFGVPVASVSPYYDSTYFPTGGQTSTPVVPFTPAGNPTAPQS